MAARRGIPFVVSAPSGTGKTTVCRALVGADPRLRFSISHTTRVVRSGEQDGVHYQFVTRERFLELVAEDAFVEHAEYAGNLYGTSWAAVDGPLAEGLDLLLEIEVQGAAQIRERRVDARLIFLLPPSRAELERRLRARGTDSEEAIANRLRLVEREFEAVHGFDYVVVNDELPHCIEQVREVVEAERSGRREMALAAHGREKVLRSLRW